MCVYFHVVTKRSLHTMSSVVHRDQTMRQVVTYKRVKAMENFKTVIQKWSQSPLIGGCLQEVSTVVI